MKYQDGYQTLMNKGFHPPSLYKLRRGKPLLHPYGTYAFSLDTAYNSAGRGFEDSRVRVKYLRPNEMRLIFSNILAISRINENPYLLQILSLATIKDLENSAMSTEISR
jgi:hypothetical protein